MATGKYVKATTETKVVEVVPEKFVFEFDREEAQYVRDLIGKVGCEPPEADRLRGAFFDAGIQLGGNVFKGSLTHIETKTGRKSPC